MKSALKQYFGFSQFRPYQKEIVEKVLQGNDCLVVMATGSGKSLCYQVPPLIANKTAVVISPLISLMQDQVMALKQRGIQAEYLSGAQKDASVHGNAERGRYQILYMTPEKACSVGSSFWSRLLDSGICLLAVDEAHCISEWGHSFRLEYKQLDRLRDFLPSIPFVGLTATATEKVRSDIMKSLKMESPHVTIGSFDRQNLFYHVKPFERGNAFLDELVKEISTYVQKTCSTIVYCTTVKDVEQIFEYLQGAGIGAGMYHGQMSNTAREEYHRSFIRDEFFVMVATVAFGMGIDKPNVRYVIHYGCPKSLESYYQESGRCGRDGIPSICQLFYTRSDFAKAEFYCADAQSADQRKAIMESYMAAQRYCMLSTCRRKFLLEYFGENWSSDNCGTCDNCTNKKKESDMSREAFLLMACIHACGGHWGLNLPVDVLRGSRAKKIVDAQFDKLPFHGLGKELPANWWKSLAYQLISRDYVVETFKDMYKTIRVGPKGMDFLKSCTPDYQPPLYLPLTPDMVGNDADAEAGLVNGLSQHQSDGLSQAEDQLYKMLVQERMKLARESGTAPYALCGDQTLRKITLTRPSTIARLANIDGVNQHFVKRYGEHVIQTIQRASKDLSLSLDGEPIVESSPLSKSITPAPRSLTSVPNNRRISPGKFEAWKMFQEDRLTIQQIANHPSRAAPIKENTVFEYILEAAREGFPIDWARICLEVGLVQEIFHDIQNVIARVGKEKLKPIKTELPEEVTYGQIKACMLMQEMGISIDVISSGEQQNNVGEPTNGTSEFSEMEKPQASTDDITCPSKRQKVDVPQEPVNIGEEATETSILNLISNFQDGVSLSDVVEYFRGSTQEEVIDILNNLEVEFYIFRKNNLYKPL